MSNPPHTMSVLEIDLPEVPNRNPHRPPAQYLVKREGGRWEAVAGRRASKMMLVPKVRAAVDAWREGGYLGVSNTTRRLLSYWFEEAHFVEGKQFQYYFCQREAVETLIYLYEVAGDQDCLALINNYADAGTVEGVFYAKDGTRHITRYDEEQDKEVVQELPREGLARVAVKMATGSGKTVVMGLLMVWSYFHKRREYGSTLANNFLLIAPNVIVYERLKGDFKDGAIFKQLPLVPQEWSGAWQLQVILRGEQTQPCEAGNLFLTNIQQIYAEPESNKAPPNPIQNLLGKAPTGSVGAGSSLLERIRSVSDLMVMNDEAHHVWDDELRWNATLLELDERLRRRGGEGRGLVGWVDLSATPKDQTGKYFPWIVTDYPLAQAVEDRIVKTPLVIKHDASADVLALAVERWRQHVVDYGEVNEKPILFVMEGTAKEADETAKRLEAVPDLKGCVLTIHTNKFGDVSKKEEEALRQASREVDKGTRYKAVVSVLMLREGWDVRNVSVIVGLRAFSAKANILPEQAVGRGLRLMRGIPAGETQILELIGTPEFEKFVMTLEKEGVGIATTKDPPKPSKPVYPVTTRAAYDIEIPKTTALYHRQYKNLDQFDHRTLPPLSSVEDLTPAQRQRIELVHGTLDVTVHSDTVAFNADHLPMVEELLAGLTNRTMEMARITGFFPKIYPFVRAYVKDRCFGGRVALDDVDVRRALYDGGLREGIAGLIARRIGELIIEQRSITVEGEPWKLSQVEAFLWSRHITDGTKTVFNVVACYNKFEADFAKFLDRSADITKFAKLCEQFTGFHIHYIKSSGALAAYYPDFVAVQKHKRKKGAKNDNATTHWIIETKGMEDVEVAAKDAQMMRWCAEVSEATGEVWRYAKVPYDLFYSERFSSLEQLVSALQRHEAVHRVRLVSDENPQAPAPPPSGPPEDVIERFWTMYGERVPKKALVFASTQGLKPGAIKTVMEEFLVAKSRLPEGFLFFVDFKPSANWAHDCAYAFVAKDGATDWQTATWPPHIDITLKAVGKP